MSQRFAAELRAELPEVDAFIGLDQVHELRRDRRASRYGRKAPAGATTFVTRSPDLHSRLGHAALSPDPGAQRLSENRRGLQSSLQFLRHSADARPASQSPPASVLAEMRRLVAEGVKEINLISQDTTYYGMDLWTAKAGPRQPVDSSRGPTLAALLREIEEIEGDFWVRLLYTHPAHWSDELIETIADCRKVARYIDMPLQHIDEAMLGRMRRETSRAHIEDLIVRLRAGIPGIALRTTFIVGFPGETEAEFESLLEFIERVRFERLGDFQILAGGRLARGENARANFHRAKKRPLPPGDDLQQRIAREIAAEKMGSELKLLVDQPFIARTEADAPEVDTRVILSSAGAGGRIRPAKNCGRGVMICSPDEIDD